MTGFFSYDDALIGTDRIDETDLTSFKIEGFKDGVFLGSLDYFTDLPFTGLETFNFNFDATLEEFYLGGPSQGDFGQIWGTGQAGGGCTTTRFGFASGSVNQSICYMDSFLQDAYISSRESSLRAARVVPTPTTISLICIGLACIRLVNRRFA